MPNPLNIIFAGTPEFARVSLSALHAAGFSIVAVYTQPDRPAGRGRHLRASAVKQFALEHHLPVVQPENFKQQATIDALIALVPDVLVVAAYGLMLPKAVLDIPTFGCINIHASLLPRWRGAAPIQRAILAGDTETGVSIMQMDEGMDTGDVLSLHCTEISPDETSASLHDKLAILGGEAIVETLQQIQNGDESIYTPQNDELVTYAPKLTKEEAKLNWQQDALSLQRAVRAYNPFPMGFAILNEQRLKVWQALAVIADVSESPGTIVAADAKGIDVACGEGLLRLTKIQWPGGRPISAADALNAKNHPFVRGACLN